MNDKEKRELFDDFLQGQNDCKNGVEHKEGMNNAYNRGYAAQYELEQVKDAIYGHQEA